MSQQLVSSEPMQQKIVNLNEEARSIVFSDPSGALKKALEVAELCKGVTSDNVTFAEEAIKSLLTQSLAHYYLADAGLSLRKAIEGNNLVTQMQPLTRLHAEALNIVASAYVRLEDYAKAVVYLREMLDVAQKLDDVDMLVGARNGLGVVCGQSGDYLEAIDHFHRGLVYGQKRDVLPPRTQVVLTGNIGHSYQLLQMWPKSIEFAEMSLEILEQSQLDDAGLLISNLCLLGVAHSKLGAIEKAECYFERIKKIIDETQDTNKVVEARLSYAEFLYETNRFVEAEHWIATVLDLVETDNQKFVTYQCHKLLADIFSAQGNFEQAYKHHVAFHTIQDELRNEENAKHARLLRISHEVDVAEKEAEIYRLRTQELERLVAERTADVLQALKLSEQTNAVRKNVIMTIMHEFRTPLTVINTSAELLHRYAEKVPVKRREKLFQSIEESARYLAELLTDMDNIEQSNQDGVQPQFLTVDALMWASTLIEQLKRDSAESTNITFALNITNQASITIDPTMTNEIAAELLANAVKFSSAAEPIQVAIGLDAEMLSIIVSDNGFGIAADEIDKIFELFYRSQTIGNIRGLGKGLYQAKTKTLLLGGTVYVESEGVGQGSVFTLRLPTQATKLYA